MNQNQFREFANNHGANFPGWMKWITELANRDDAVAAYRSMFANIPVDDAFAATTAMVSERIAKPIAYEDVMPTLAQFARKRVQDRETASKPKIVRKEIFYCGNCRDTGWIEVFHPRTVRHAKEGKFDAWQRYLDDQRSNLSNKLEDENLSLVDLLKIASRETDSRFDGFKDWRSVMIYCDCDAGQQLSVRHDGTPVRYWEKQHVFNDPQKTMSQLIDAMKSCEGKPKNYVNEFDEFNSSNVLEGFAS